MEINAWTSKLKPIYEAAVERYRGGDRNLEGYFDEAEQAFLASIGLRPINLYDHAEDFVNSGLPDWETTLLILSVRRDYFLTIRNGEPSTAEIRESELPPKDAEWEGIRWLPRITRKARCFLEGNLCHDIMYCCGGDRRFLREHRLHPADFLRAVWGAKGENQKVIDYVRKNAQP